MEKITGNEPFYPCQPTDNKMLQGITIRQEAILRFMVSTSGNWVPHMANECVEDAVKFADAYIKALNNEQ